MTSSAGWAATKMPDLAKFTQLHLRHLRSGRWILSEALYYFRKFGETIEVPPAFLTDMDSVPRIPVVYAAFKGRAVRSAVIHDYLYETQAGKSYADAVFLDAMRDEGLPAHCRYPIYWAVAMFGGRIYADKG